MFEEAGQRLDAGLKRRVLRLHLAAEAGHHSHGRVQSVFVNQVTAVSDETQHAVQTAGLEHGARLPGTDQLQHLHNARASKLSMTYRFFNTYKLKTVSILIFHTID